MTPPPPTELTDDRADPESRSVLTDWQIQHGGPSRLTFAVAISYADAADDGDDGDDDAAAGDAADDDGDAADAAGDAADDAADAADDAADAADADDDADDLQGLLRRDRAINKLLTEEIDMREGLKIITVVGGYYGRSIVRVGWVKRRHGDEYDLLGACTIRRNGSYELGALDRIAVEGPGKTHTVSKQQPGSIEELHRLTIRRPIVANEKAWAKACPKPADWNVDR